LPTPNIRSVSALLATKALRRIAEFYKIESDIGVNWPTNAAPGSMALPKEHRAIGRSPSYEERQGCGAP
jgi:hypothetical protein